MFLGYQGVIPPSDLSLLFSNNTVKTFAMSEMNPKKRLYNTALSIQFSCLAVPFFLIYVTIFR